MPSLRLLDPSDDRRLAGVARALHDFNVEFDTPTPGEQAIADRLARHLGARMFVVLAHDGGTEDEDAGDVIGVAVVSLRPNVWFDGPVALLDELYVRPDRRNGGVGSALIASLRAEAALRGVEHLEINVDEGDHDARRFYERHGFSPVDPDSGEPAFVYSGPVHHGDHSSTSTTR